MLEVEMEIPAIFPDATADVHGVSKAFDERLAQQIGAFARMLPHLARTSRHMKIVPPSPFFFIRIDLPTGRLRQVSV
jgi:hypothetical protein